jgi:hypothetical protein
MTTGGKLTFRAISFNPLSDAATRPLCSLGVVATAIARQRLAVTARLVRAVYAKLGPSAAGRWHRPVRAMKALSGSPMATEAALHAVMLLDVLRTFGSEDDDLDAFADMGYPDSIVDVLSRAALRLDDGPTDVMSYLDAVDAMIARANFQALLVQRATIADQLDHERGRMDDDEVVAKTLALEAVDATIGDMLQSAPRTEEG